MADRVNRYLDLSFQSSLVICLGLHWRYVYGAYEWPEIVEQDDTSVGGVHLRSFTMDQAMVASAVNGP